MDEATLQEIEKFVREWLRANGSEAWSKVRYRIMELYAPLTGSEADCIILPLVKEYEAAVAQETAEPVLPPPAPPPERLPAKRKASVPMQVRARGMARVEHLGHMAAKLEAYSLKPDEESPDGTAINFPVLYVKSSDMLVKAIEIDLKVGASLLSMDRVRDFVGGLAEIINRNLSTLAPEVRDQIGAEVADMTEKFSKGEL